MVFQEGEWGEWAKVGLSWVVGCRVGTYRLMMRGLFEVTVCDFLGRGGCRGSVLGDESRLDWVGC